VAALSAAGEKPRIPNSGSLYDYSPDMKYLEIVGPASFKTVDMPPATDKVPQAAPWR
jgi:hypothetical protein